MNAQGEAILSLARRRGLLDEKRLKTARRLEGDGSRIRSALEKLGLDTGTIAKLVRELAAMSFRCPKCAAEFSYEALASLDSLACGRCAVPLSGSEARSKSGKKSKLTTSRTRSLELEEIGPYALTKLLGKGASGSVHLARKEGLDRDFAVKILTANTFEDQLALERFRREAQIASRLQHPGIVSVVDVGEEGGLHYYVMEHVAGPTLQALLEEKAPLPPELAALVVAELARAIAFAHENGIVHRDLKPANVILDDSTGKPRITDFGLARDARDHRVTRTGDILGTPYYMAPEQFTGDKDLDGRTDCWALGVILFEALTGERPFEAKTAAMLATSVLTGELRSPSEVKDGIPPALDAVCRRALARDREKRYRTADELADDLDAFRKQGKVSAKAETTIEKTVRKTKRRLGVKQLVVVGLVTGALAGLVAPWLVRKLATARTVDAPDEVEQLLDSDASLAKVRLAVEKRNDLPPRVAERWAERLLRAGCYAESLRVATPLLKDPALVDSASRTTAEANAKQGELALAAEALADLASRDPSARARRLFFQRHPAEAAEAALDAIAARPTDAWARRTAAVALLRRGTDVKASAQQALKFAREALDLEPLEPDSHVVWAYAARSAGQPLDAVDAALDRAFALTAPEPPDPLAYLTRAWVALQRREPAKARSALQAPLLRASQEPEVRALECWTRFTLDQEDWVEARRSNDAAAFEATLDELARLIRGEPRVALSLAMGYHVDQLLEQVEADARPAVKRALLAGFEAAPATASDDWWRFARALAPRCPKTAFLHARALVGRDCLDAAEKAIVAARALEGGSPRELDRLHADCLWRRGHVAEAGKIWGELRQTRDWIGDYAQGALLSHKAVNPHDRNVHYGAACERAPDHPELFRAHAYSVLVIRALDAKEVDKQPALDSARRAFELEGAFDLQNLFLIDYGEWSLKLSTGDMAEDQKQRTRDLGAKYAALAPDTGFYVYSLYRVAMKWPESSMAMLRFLERSAQRDVKPWLPLARAWVPLREGVGKDNQKLSHDEELARLLDTLREVRKIDPEFWIPLEFVNRITGVKDWNTPLPPELRNGTLP